MRRRSSILLSVWALEMSRRCCPLRQPPFKHTKSWALFTWAVGLCISFVVHSITITAAVQAVVESKRINPADLFNEQRYRRHSMKWHDG